jgi:hypothetical protein
MRMGRSVATRLFVVTLGIAGAQGVGCSSSPGDVHATFVGVMAGSSSSGPVSGSLTVKVDGAMAMGTLAFASQGSAGSPGGQKAQMTGSAHGTSYSMASTDGWQMKGDVSGSKTKGTISGPNGAMAKFSGEDSAKGMVTLYCGTYSGSDSGVWNFAVGPSGELSGAFSGLVSGEISGSGSAQSVSITWSASDALAGNLSGTAQGSVSASNAVTGSWQGSGQSGTFMSDQSCPGAPTVVTADGGSIDTAADAGSTTSSCLASGSVCTSPGLCCAGQCYSQSGGGSYCY